MPAVLNDLAVPLPRIDAWTSRLGLIEEYEYPPARAEQGRVHVHREMQICLSIDFPGRYSYRGRLHDVPARAVSVVDAWEPHAVSDPIDRDRRSHYVVMYVDPMAFRASVDLQPAAQLDVAVHADELAVTRFQRLERALRAQESPLAQDERFCELAGALAARGSTTRQASPAVKALLRARDYIAARAPDRISLAQVAAIAGLTPWHFARAFRRQFGLPPHRFQLGLRVDLARRLLADGIPGSEVAHRTGFADQSHLIRCFKRMIGTTPARRPAVR